MAPHCDFQTFLAQFERAGDLFVPRQQNANEYRHYGMKRGSRLYLSADDLLHLYSKTPPAGCSLGTRAYFELRNSQLNLITDPSGEAVRVYERTKHFRREAAPAIGALVHRNRDDEFVPPVEDTVACVMGADAYCFLHLRPVESLSFVLDRKLHKQPNGQQQ
ncbi:hypothetical protein PAPHI01_0886 [Pancytospora philotis]|nr:hypothetical protein PAPHI01_0886 [Pancytospora philotis]